MPSPSVCGVVPAEEMQKFLDHAVHDLRAVLRKIGTSIEMAEMSGADHSRDGAYPMILEGIAHGTAILTGIGTYSSALGTHYSFKPINLDLAVDSAVAQLEGQIRETRGQVVRGSLPEVVGDPERLTDLFRLLLSNALTYRSAEPPKIDISARADGGEWTIQVRDNGIGIAPKYHGELLRPFYRLHGSEIPGVGLGLAACQKIVEAHQGRIWVESEAGAGAAFLFTLPM